VLGRVKTISVKRDNQRWYVLLSCDDVPPEPLERTGSVVGIDLGVKSFLMNSARFLGQLWCLVDHAAVAG
jgi:putative transposase